MCLQAIAPIMKAIGGVAKSPLGAAALGGGAALGLAKQLSPGVQEISPPAQKQDIGDVSSKQDLAALERRKKGIKSTILAGNEGQSGGNTLLGGG